MSASNGTARRTAWHSDHPAVQRGQDGGLTLGVPSSLIDAIAERTADLLAERLPDRPEPYLNVEQAAKYLAASTHRVYDLRRQGLSAFKDGTRLLFRRQDLDDWVAQSDVA